MRRIFRFSLVRRFLISLREEGVRQAFTKTRIFVGIRLRGVSPTILTRSNQGVIHTDQNYLAGIWQTLAREDAFHSQTPPALISKRRQIALIGDLNLPQCRKYRVEQLAEFWEARGVGISYKHYQDVPGCIAMLQNATHLMEYRLKATPLTAMYRYEARRLRLSVLYDLDDPLFSISAYETYENMNAVEPELKARFLAEAPKYLEMMNGADIISVSTPGMAEHTKLLTQRPVHVRRNFADRATLDGGWHAMKSAKHDDGLFRVCFASGSRGHEVDFELIGDQVAAFLDSNANHRLMLLGHFDMKLLPKGLRGQVEALNFSSYDSYLRSLAKADASLMPLTDDIFNRCKSSVRVIDAASVGVPSLVSQVGDLASLVRDGETGFVVKDAKGWSDALGKLSRDKLSAADMGKAARTNLEVRWSGSSGELDPDIFAPEILAWVEE